MIQVTKLPAHEWRRVSADAHRAVFGKTKPASWDRIDYALLMVEQPADQVVCYVTVRETDPHTAYWQFGGAFPQARGTPAVYRAFCEAVDFQRKKSKRISMLIENTNQPMMRMAGKRGFLISGVRYFRGTVLVEHLLEFDKGA